MLEQQWSRVHPTDMENYVQQRNVQGWTVLAVVLLNSASIGVLSERRVDA